MTAIKTFDKLNALLDDPVRCRALVAKYDAPCLPKESGGLTEDGFMLLATVLAAFQMVMFPRTEEIDYTCIDTPSPFIFKLPRIVQDVHYLSVMRCWELAAEEVHYHRTNCHTPDEAVEQ